MTTFNELFAAISERAEQRPAGSETTKWLELGVHSIGKKIVEEAAEVWMAAEYEGNDRLAEEMSQLIYHLMVMMAAKGLTLADLEKNF
ncbi:MAG: phosphoribosyl-ATP pyrophosphatase [Actinomycetota bacterium]|jgi:phosphoribosyl-ATP pyrophosphohydrolase